MPFASLNLGALTADDAANVAENRRRAVTGAGGDGATATMAWQVHGMDIREVTDEPSSGRFLQPGAEPFPKSDGLVTSSRGRALTLLTADCLPVAIAAADGSRLALLHAGWRGIEAGVIEAGVASVGGEAVAAIGPGAGPCCYEVGEDVAGPLTAPLRGGRRPRRPRRPVAVRRARASHERRPAGGSCGRVHDLHRGSLLLAPARARRHRPAGGGGAACLTRP